MKEVMRKITLFSFYKETGEITGFLQELGVIHVEQKNGIADEKVEDLYGKIKDLEKVLDELDSLAVEITDTDCNEDIAQVSNLVLRIRKERQDLRQQLNSVEEEREKAVIWGDFDRNKYKQIENTGAGYHLYTLPAKDLHKLDLSPYTCAVINRIDTLLYMVFIGRDLDPELQPFFERARIPDRSAAELETIAGELKHRLNDLERELSRLSPCRQKVHNEIIRLKDRIHFREVLNSHEERASGKLSVLVGWYPKRIEDELLHKINERGLGFITEAPKRTDDVPVLLKNSAYSGLFEPITRIFQLPSYHELDLTPVIAVFYPIFFAYCLGDAGYGLIVTIAGVVSWFTFLKQSRKMAILIFLLGIITTVMGIVKSGSVFGLPVTIDSEVPLFRFLSNYILIPDDQDYTFNAFNVALMFGVLQILVGVIASIINRAYYYTVRDALPQVGKLMIVIGVLVLFLVRMQDVSELMPYENIAEIMLYAGILTVLPTNYIHLPLLKRIGSGVLPLFFIFTGILGDILSYVRLFALGVASSVLGLVINRIGMQIMDDSWWSILLGVVFLLFGHALNLSLAVLGAFVHPLRLTFVEFYNNAGFQGGGKEYKPFKKELETK